MKLGISPQKSFRGFAAGALNFRFSNPFFPDSFFPPKKKRPGSELRLNCPSPYDAIIIVTFVSNLNLEAPDPVCI